MKFEVILARDSRRAKRNSILNANDSGGGKSHMALKKRLRTIGKALAMEQIKGVVFSEENPCTVTMTVSNDSKRKFDPDNLQPTLKSLMDGFTDGGLWTDDNCYVVKQTAYRFGGHGAPKGYYKLEIEVEPIWGSSKKSI